MQQKSKRTKRLTLWSVIFGILHILCLIGPFLFFIPQAFIIGETIAKIALGLTTIISLILAAISAIVDINHRAGLHRSILWILISGILFCLDSVKSFIWIMAISSLLDELIFTKAHQHFARKAAINKEIDLRLE